MKLQTTLTRQIEIRSLHSLGRSDWSTEKNRQIYGECAEQHGHHYKIQVTVTADVDPVSGLLIDRDRLDRVLRESVIVPYDGANLNEHFPNTACEALARSLYERLKGLIESLDARLVRIGIQETRKNYFEFPPVTSNEF